MTTVLEFTTMVTGVFGTPPTNGNLQNPYVNLYFHFKILCKEKILNSFRRLVVHRSEILCLDQGDYIFIYRSEDSSELT